MKLSATSIGNFTGTLMCRVLNEEGQTVGQFRGKEEEQEEFEALVRLWTTAPDLLAALESMVAMMDCGDEPGEGSPWHTEAKAAIAKAKGEA